jgi:glycosyltransferase involved in cell wall biosynthesis
VSNATRSPRILIIDLAHRFGGASVRALGLLSRLPPGRGALATLAGTPVTECARAMGLDVHMVGASKFDPRIPARLAPLIRKGQFKVLDAQNPQSILWSRLASARTGSALVSTLNSLPEIEYRAMLRGRAYQLLRRASRNGTDLFIAVSSEIRTKLKAEGIPDQAIALIPNAVDINPNTISADAAWLCKTYQLRERWPVCCAAGRLVEAKGFRYLISSIDLLRRAGRKLYCLIVGEGHLRHSLAKQISRLNLQNHVRLLGFRDHTETLKIIKACDLFVIPSLTEGAPIALLEAAALARPIVASRVGGIPDILTDREHGLLVDPRDEIGLAGALAWLCDRTIEAAGLAARARERIAREYNFQVQTEALERAYNTAWARRQGRL